MEGGLFSEVYCLEIEQPTPFLAPLPQQFVFQLFQWQLSLPRGVFQGYLEPF
jgi:hypothetical protein